ncbi:IS30 family transposase [Aliifodinibius sp. S!AR15-10]|uniref:IS30 family transposase n=1 Tax=Aliifodinibius sp. S!AR15-10 TaxID=2950437 RepID=UPI002859EB82|nr:IS30 family transposase [Aliifodinibius sp. S!AR15-10]MDR8394685.1 IS30 family transposase [Aliifodinibius sp. S!AR15-10]
MQEYTQLSEENRHQIKALLDAGHTQSEIARTIGVHRSTICRELKRNVPNDDTGDNQYCPETAQQLTNGRHRDKPKHHRFTDDLKNQARRWLTQEKLSPELISGRWQVLGTHGVSHETLYQWIWAAKLTGDPQDKDLYKHLKHGRRKAKRGNRQDSRGRIKGRVSITDRPDVVEKRQRLGDIEVDLMMGKAHKSALLVLTDRATLLTKLRKVTSKKAEPMAQAIIGQLSDIPSSFIKTLTFDNDKAFAHHQNIAEALGADTYFTRPYTSQDKGTVENRIWVIRRFFPKGTDLRDVSAERINTVEEYLNFRPVRKFDYLNPIQQTLKHRCVALVT